MPPQTLAVLTGDLVASSRLPPPLRDGAFEALGAAAGRIAAWQGSGGDGRFSRFRGDGWQMILARPALALRACLFLRASLRTLDRRLDSRISIGVGPASLPQNGALAAASGPAFEASGRGLDHMARVERFVFAAPDAPETGLRRAVVALADEISRRWTARQARVFAAALQPEAPVQAAIADALDISQQAVAKHLQAGGDWAIRRGIMAFETL
jgi:hypothetical protein